MLASFGLHALALAVLLGARLPIAVPLEELIWASGPPPQEELLLHDAALEPSEVEPPVGDADVPVELIDPGLAPLGSLSDAAAMARENGEPSSLAEGLAGELGSLIGAGGGGRAMFDSGLGDDPTAQFFGKKIEGRRIVFILDNSGSMQGGRLETVVAELLRCVDLLEDDQEFYVIFHSDMVYPLFYPDPVDRYIRPTDANKRLLARWLDTVELCLGDSVEEAIAVAQMIEPDTVFLLSDGRITGEKKMSYLLAGETRPFPIHTFAVGMGASIAGRRNLEAIAAANGGEFRESDIPAEMKDLARRQPRPYHNEVPGEIWGRNVKPFRPRR